jgi:hypothetical protein
MIIFYFLFFIVPDFSKFHFFSLSFFILFLLDSPHGAVCAVPKGLMDYITPYDVCESMPALREYLTAKFHVGDAVSEVTQF